MNTAESELPELSEESIDRIERAVFETVAAERRGDRVIADRRRVRRRGWLTAGGLAAAFVVGVLVTAPFLAAVRAGSGVAENSVATSAGGAAPQISAVAPDSAAREVVTSAWALLRVDDVGAGVAGIEALAQRHGGYVESRQLGTGVPQDPRVPSAGDTRPDSGTIAIRVPAADVPTVLDSLAGYGTVLSSQIGEVDVTAAVTDLRAEVTSLTSSVERLTELMRQAGSVADLLAAETALTARQAKLQSATQQLKDLEARVAMSSVQVSLVRTQSASADPGGFTDGLAAGWNGFLVSLNALIVAAGFLLPWLGVALVVLLVVWGVLRLRRRARGTRDPAEPR